MNRTRAWTVGFLALGAGIAIALWFKGSDYYTTHPWDRAAHPDNAALNSGGSWGHGEGIVGTALILLNLTFMLRRRLSSMRRFGALRLWMNMHVVTGLVGPLIVVYHTAFYPRTTVAITAFASLGVLVLTGVVGRFIYAMIPHTVAGAEMGRDDLEKRLVEAREHLATAASPEDPLWQRLEKLSSQPLLVPHTSFGCLMLLPYSIVSTMTLRARLFFLGRSRHDVDWHDVHDIVLIRRRLHTLTLYRKLLRWWRGLHRVFALVMVVTMTIHVVVLLYLGYVPGQGAMMLRRNMARALAIVAGLTALAGCDDGFPGTPAPGSCVEGELLCYHEPVSDRDYVLRCNIGEVNGAIWLIDDVCVDGQVCEIDQCVDQTGGQ